MKDKPPASNLINVIETILEAQKTANDFSKLPVWERCDPLKKMIPVMLFCCEDALELFGALECKQSFSTCFFVIEKIDDSKSCIVVRLLKPCSVVCPTNEDKDCIEEKYEKKCVLIPTPYHSTVGLECLKRIKCFSPSLIIQELFKTETRSDNFCCKVTLEEGTSSLDIWKSELKKPINGTITFSYRVGELPYVELIIERDKRTKEPIKVVKIQKGECISVTLDQIKSIQIAKNNYEEKIIGDFQFQLNYCEKELVQFKL